MRRSTHLSKRTKEHYGQQGKNNYFFIGHRLWIYYSVINAGLWKKIITPRCIHSIGIYEIKQQGDYILIQVVQEEFGHERDLLQLQNELKLKNSKPQPDLVTIFKTPLRHCSKNVSDDAVARLLKAHLVQTVTTIKQFSDSRMGKNLFYSMRDWNVTILDHLNISFHRR